MRISEHFAGKYFRADDFDKSGRNLTIESVEIEKVGRDEKMVIHFEGEDNTFPINRTNALEIAELLGKDDTDDWSGETINVYRDTTMFNGKRVGCMRVRAMRRIAGAGNGHGDTSFNPAELESGGDAAAAAAAVAAAPADGKQKGSKRA